MWRSTRKNAENARPVYGPDVLPSSSRMEVCSSTGKCATDVLCAIRYARLMQSRRRGILSMRKEANILFVGVGGQGTISASNLLSAALIDLGYDVKMSEVHGMAQRGGSVSTQVRYGERVHSPLIEKGTADYIVSFEKSES